MRHRLRLLTLSGLLVALFLSFALSSTAHATSLTLSGGWSYQYGTNTVTLAVGKITNNASGGNSGSLRLELWAFSTPYDGTALLLTEYNGSSYVVRHYLLARTGETFVCPSASCKVVEPPPSVERGGKAGCQSVFPHGCPRAGFL